MRISDWSSDVCSSDLERNFLDFAKLVPGVVTSRDPTQKTFSSGGQSAENVNVFIDGASLKNNVLKGGIAGQDSTRGNPFSQEAVQEFRVLTNNYKAEYEQIGRASCRERVGQYG